MSSQFLKKLQGEQQDKAKGKWSDSNCMVMMINLTVVALDEEMKEVEDEYDEEEEEKDEMPSE